MADFFQIRNVVFFQPGDHQVSLLEQLVDYENVICNIGDPSTLKDADWKAADLIDLDKYMEEAKRLFPEKLIHLGLYLYDYGDTCDTLPLDLVQFQFGRARQYLKNGVIEGFHLLGSYLKQELESEQAIWIADTIAQAGQ